MKNIIYVIVMAMMPFVLLAQKKRPDSMKVSEHKKLIQEYSEKFSKEALTSPKVKKLTEDIESLKKPLSLNDEVELRVPTRRGGTGILKGRLYSVSDRKVLIKDREYFKSNFDPIDWLRLQAAKKPDMLKGLIEKKEIEKKGEIKDFIENKTSSTLVADGYNRNFLKNVVVIGSQVPHYVLKHDAGDGTFIVGVFKYDTNGRHMENFVKVVVDYKGKLPLAFVVAVDNPNKKGQPLVLCRYGKTDAAKKITEVPFKAKNFYLSKAMLQKELGEKWETILLNDLRVLLLKRKGLWDGIWQLEKARVIPVRSNARPRPLDCPDCWGKRHVSMDMAVDIRKEVEAVLKEAHASEEIKKKGEALIREFAAEKEDHGAEKEGAKKEACPTCNAKGTVGFVRATGGIIVFQLDEKKGIFSYQKKLPEFTTLYKSVISTDAVNKLREGIAGEFAKKRLEARKAEGVERAKELVSEFLEVLNKSKHVALERRYEWMTLKELEAIKKDNSPAVAPVMFGGKEKSGYAPKTLFDKKVRRLGPWKQHRDFKSLGGLREGYNIFQVYYRVVEIGGSDIDAEPAKPATDGTGRPTEPMEGEFLEDPRGTVPPPRGAPRGRGDDPDFMGPEGTPDGEVPPKIPVSEVPEDIGDREYVFQYAILANARNKRITVKTDVELTMKPRLTVDAPAPAQGEEAVKLMGFPLANDEKKLTLHHTFRIPNGWNGWMLGSKKMTFNQMISEYGYQTLKVKATVK